MKTPLVLFAFTLIGVTFATPVTLSADSTNTTALLDTADHTTDTAEVDHPDLTGRLDVGPRLTLSDMLHDPDPLPFSFRPYPSQYRLSEDGLQHDVFRHLTEAALIELKDRRFHRPINEARLFMEQQLWRVNSDTYERHRLTWPKRGRASQSP